MSASKVRVTLTRSPNGEKKVHHATLAALGLGKIGTSRVHVDSASFRGMVRKVAHLVTLETAEASAPVGAESHGRIRVGHGRAIARVIPAGAATGPEAGAPASVPAATGDDGGPIEAAAAEVAPEAPAKPARKPRAKPAEAAAADAEPALEQADADDTATPKARRPRSTKGVKSGEPE